ncbi:MAG: SpoIIE family protein phosphatase [Gammaproteobacteria bacterium]|jgi:sigma-B regulation protein RsbU (phosphoserine phosphatase)|nr:SpoIIE family protein phosphatase [Gammaproteobacteria bacterium]
MSKDTALDPLFQGGMATPERLAGLLADVTHEFASSLNVEETLQNAIDQIIVYLNAEAASIFLLEDDDSALICRKCAGPVDVTGLRLLPDQGIVGETVSQNAAQIVRDVSKNENFSAVVDEDTGFITRSIMCAPLTVRGRCIGALELINKRSGDRLFAASDMHLATAVASAAALAIHNARMAQALVEQERVRKELELARQIQMSLLPAAAPASFPVHGLNIPAREVSGDFFDYCEVDGGRIYFSVADVSGKGMNAALLMAKTTSLLRCLAKSTEGPAELLAKVNAEICETASLGMFVTIVAGYFYPDSGVVELSNAGHQPPLFWCRDGKYEELVATAPPIGILAEVSFETTRVELGDGSLYIFTDGVTESLAPDGTDLGVEGLCTIIDAASRFDSERRLEEIVERIHDQGRTVHDDLTLLLIETNSHV